MNGLILNCREELRREDVRAASLFGLDYVEVGTEEGVGEDDHRTLQVWCLGKAPEKFEKENLVIVGGRRIRDVRIVDLRVVRLADLTRDDHLEIVVDKAGDFSLYTLSAVDVDAAVGGNHADRCAATAKIPANLFRPPLIRHRQLRNRALDASVGCGGLQARRVVGRHGHMDATID